ncbi:lipocalin-like domain-containing protein [Shewanella acanthi]|uniref:lipocalin-like domain-containing protein n=1 Tax=Shewanella acanthi TaxID=2864212 RepID=UPI001C6549B2|nr:lipocalin-like domain-containing protein [Shewanella acanthi]QYJ78292.1 carotenoid 1,2-hydratase [Shewanella acanthi]
MSRKLPILTTLVFMGLQLAGCDTPSTQSMGNILGSPNTTAGNRFLAVTPNASLRFPQDHLAHNGFRQEWWYFTANLKTKNGEPLGLQWTQFRVALASEFQVSQKNSLDATSSEDAQSDWATQQLYFAHSALTSQEQHLAHEKWSRAHPKLANVNPSPYQIYLDDWRWQSESDDLFPATLKVRNSDFSFNLQLSSQAPLQLQGDNGFSIKSLDGEVASYYYSQPFIEVSGQIERNGHLEDVTGFGWLDREWSSQFLTKAQQGWDWFALRLDDDSTLMVFQLRNTSAAQSPQKGFYSARRMFKDGTGRNITSRDNPKAIEMKALKFHDTQTARYPVEWQISIPSEQIDLKVAPLNPNSSMALSTSYWEGPVSLNGSHSGVGYMELTGY